jgi:hypothetical protein
LKTKINTQSPCHALPRQQILLTGFSEGPKVEESQMTGTESKLFFLQGPKPESAQITGTKRGINPNFID